MTALLKGSSPCDLIAYAWFVMGFRPRESLVVVGLGDHRDSFAVLDDGFDDHDADHEADHEADDDRDDDRADDRADAPEDDPEDDLDDPVYGGDEILLGAGLVTSGAVVRLDLPSTRAARAAADSVADLLHRAGDDACLVLVVSDTGGHGSLVRADGRMPHEATARRVHDRLRARGVAVIDVLLVGPDRFRTYLCGTDCCDAAGTSLDAVATSPVAVSMVLRGRAVADREEDLVADVEPVLAAARAEPPLTAPSRRPGRAALRTVLRRWCADLDADSDEPTRAQELLDALPDRGLRDAVLLCLVPGCREAAAALLAGEVGADAAPLDLPPDPVLARAGRRLLASLARRAPAGHRAEPLALLAWLAWWTGDAVRARLLAGLALAEQPGHRMARLVDSLLAASVPPPWTEAGRPPVLADVLSAVGP